MTVVKMETLVKIIETGEFQAEYNETGRYYTITTWDKRYTYTRPDFVELNKYLNEEIIWV